MSATASDDRNGSGSRSRCNLQDPVQAEVVTWLRSAEAHPGVSETIETLTTHGAIVVLAGRRAFKMKRAVRYPYMDFSTLERRRQMIARELAINRRHAPSIYVRVSAITRERDGRLAFDGAGTPIEYVLEMRRFPEADLLSSMAARGRLASRDAVALGEAISATHRSMQPHFVLDADARVRRVISDLTRELQALAGILDAEAVAAFDVAARKAHAAVSDLLRHRGEAGFVRRCHGDLHLANIVMLDGRPTPFDAIEFNDDLAIVDTLYDLAFLLMDLEHARLRPLANQVLNRYLWRSAAALELRALAALPLFLALRSAVRAMTNGVRARIAGAGPDGTIGPDQAAARAYLDAARRYLAPPRPRLIAVGGLSGTGKSTLAAALAPSLLPDPGAIHLRSDLERKSMLGAGETERLPRSAYAAGMSARVYALLFDKARLALAAGHSVVVDGVFLLPRERAAVEALAAEARVAMTGLWLTAPPTALLERVEARERGGTDASDATASVVARQLTLDSGPLNWSPIEAGGAPEATLAQALRCIGPD